MKRPNRRPTLRARRMDEWRRTNPNSLYAPPILYEGPAYAVWNGHRTERYYGPTKGIHKFILKNILLQRAADINRFETLERQLFGHRVALYNKLARS